MGTIKPWRTAMICQGRPMPCGGAGRVAFLIERFRTHFPIWPDQQPYYGNCKRYYEAAYLFKANFIRLSRILGMPYVDRSTALLRLVSKRSTSYPQTRFQDSSQWHCYFYRQECFKLHDVRRRCPLGRPGQLAQSNKP
jgi:hypothetical protein